MKITKILKLIIKLKKDYLVLRRREYLSMGASKLMEEKLGAKNTVID